MISGFDRAVGPMHPAERPVDMVPYGCQIGLGMDEAAACSFTLWDGGTGRTFVNCGTHDYWFVAIDWTAPHFGGGATLEESLGAIRELFGRLKAAGFEGVDETAPTGREQRFGEVFAAIVKNLEAIARSE